MLIFTMHNFTVIHWKVGANVKYSMSHASIAFWSIDPTVGGQTVCLVSKCLYPWVISVSQSQAGREAVSL